MIVIAISLLVVLLALREVSTNRIHRARGNSQALRRWRAARRWLNLALLLTLLAFLPALIDAPQVPIIAEAHTMLRLAGPLILGAAGFALALAVRTATPEVQREVQTRRTARQRRERAHHGHNPERTSTQLQEWLQHYGPRHRYRFDQPTRAGVANIVIHTQETRYAVYLLPPEHAEHGMQTAITRCEAIAGELQAHGLVWVPQETPTEPQHARGRPVYVVRDSINEALKLIERNDNQQRRRRERRQQSQRRAARDGQQESAQRSDAHQQWN